MEMFINFIVENLAYNLLIVVWLFYFWELYLTWRQRKLIQKLTTVPECLNGLMAEDVYEKARSYALDKSDFQVLKDLHSVLFTTVLISTQAFYYFWQWGLQFIVACGFSEQNEIVTSAACMFIMNTVTIINNLPFMVYSTFILEEKYGFNKQTGLFFIKDQIKKFIVTTLIVLPFLSGIIWIVQNGGDYFFLYLWSFTAVVSLFIMILYPEVIAPLFDKYNVLPEGDLKQKIEALAASIHFPLYKLYIVENSKRSSHSNAYFYGFHKHKRIVLFDTLVKEYAKQNENDSNKDQGCETEEILGILAHELGHWKFSHTLKGFLLYQVNVMINFILFAKLLHFQPMYEAFGFMDSQPIFIGLIIVTLYILMPLDMLMGFILMIYSRKFEFQADNFAKTLGYADSIKRALIKLHKDNLGYPLYDKLYSGWHCNHPPLLERLEALSKDD